MTVSKLTLYNGALLELGERAIASLSENIEARRLLDRAWEASDGAVNYCLGQGQWKFALRTLELASSVSMIPAFGYQKAFDIPTDSVRTVKVCSDPYMNVPLLQYATEQAYLFADIEPVYLTYVSNDASFGADYSLWPDDFTRYVELYLATKIAKKLNQSDEDRKTLFALAKRALADAKSSSAAEGPTVFPPPGSWTSARFGRSSGRRGRSSQSQLIG